MDLAFLVPADDVATNTQKLVDLVTAIIIGFATVFSLSTILILWRLQRDMQRDALQPSRRQICGWKTTTSSLPRAMPS